MIVVGPEDPLVKESTITSKVPSGAKAYYRDRSFGSEGNWKAARSLPKAS